MTIEERKQKTYEGLQLLEKDIIRLQNNISELKQILEDIHTDAYCEAKRPDLRSETVAFRF